MNHGSIGYIDDQSIVLPIDLLRPLSITDGSRVLGVYYPKPSEEGDYKFVNHLHDFMLTPIPLRFWPVTGRLLVRLRHGPGAMQEATNWFAERGVTILSAECCRSGYRYATWNLTIAFESIKFDSFDPEKSEHVATNAAVEELMKKIDLAFPYPSKVLFRDKKDWGLQDAIEGVPARAHSYFYEHYQRNKNDALCNPFELFCSHSKLHSRDHRLGAIFDQLGIKISKSNPSCVLAEMDTRDFNIRIAVFPPSELPRFFEVSVPYRRSGGPSSRGLLATLTQELGINYNLWRVYNLTSQNAEDVEAGEVRLVIEDTSLPFPDRNTSRNKLEALLSKLDNRLRQDKKGIYLRQDWQISPITPARIQARLAEERERITGYKYDVFISYGKKDGTHQAKEVKRALEKQGLTAHLDTVDVSPGDMWRERLIENVRKSAEVAVICTPKSLNRPWIALEIGCALALHRKVTGIICGNINAKSIPDYIKQFQLVYRKKDRGLQKYAEVVQRRIGASQL